MKITKFGHCCMLLEEQGLRILTDPGIYSDQQNNLNDIDVILITHEHSDHFHIDSLKIVLEKNPNAKVYTNPDGVGVKLQKEEIAFIPVHDGNIFTEKEVKFEVFGSKHACLHSSIAVVPNNGYFIANRFFYPGDSFTNPKKDIEICALPVAGPWTRLQEAIDYALELKPKIAFPVHDGILINIGTTNTIPLQVLEPKGIKFQVLEIDKEYEF